MHVTFVVKFGKCGLHMKKCNVMESCTMFITFFPYFVIFDFDLIFLENTY